MSKLAKIEGAQQGTNRFLGPELTLLTFDEFGDRPVIRCHQAICNHVELQPSGEQLIAVALRVDDMALGYFLDAHMARLLAAQLLKGADILDARKHRQ